MASKRRNGGGNGQDPTVKALHAVVAEVRGVATELRGLREDTNSRFREADARMERVEGVLLDTRHELRETNVRLGKVEAGLEDLRSEIHEGFAEVAQKIRLRGGSRPASRGQRAAARRAGGAAGSAKRRGALMLALRDRAGLSGAEKAALERELAPLRMLEAVVRWGYTSVPPREVADVVVQDEFSHDVVLPWERGRYLVFDTT